MQPKAFREVLRIERHQYSVQLSRLIIVFVWRIHHAADSCTSQIALAATPHLARLATFAIGSIHCGVETR